MMPTKKLLSHQYDFVFSDERFVLLAGGLGSGKTTAGAWFVINESVSDPKTKGLICANSYRQLRNATLTSLFREMDENQIEYDYNEHKGWLNIEDAFWYCYSMDNHDNIRGIEVNKIWNDETRDTDEAAFHILTGRLRDRSGQSLKARYTSTPFGFNYLYDYFLGDKKTPEHRVIRATSMNNPYLPDGYMESMKNSFDSKIYAQEVLGEFINVTQGRIYYGFDRVAQVKELIINKAYPIYVGMDFNINPMTAVVTQCYNDTIHVIDEFYINTSNTNEMAAELLRKYGKVVVIPDSTGKRTQTSSSGKSDHQILRDAGHEVKSTLNPFRIDRYNTVNNLFEKGRIAIDKKCVKLIRDFEQVTYKEGTSLPDNNDLTLGHISDGLGYVAWFMFPILPRKNEIKMMPR
jgi:hypothetical protein